MALEIITERVKTVNGLGYEVIALHCLPNALLSNEYKTGIHQSAQWIGGEEVRLSSGACVKQQFGVAFRKNAGEQIRIYPGDIISRDQMERVIKPLLNLCVKNYHEIKKLIDKECDQEWSGEAIIRGTAVKYDN